MQLSLQEWTRVAEAPVIVFVLVAYADGTLSEEERATFFTKWRPRLANVSVAHEAFKPAYLAGLEKATESLRPYTRQSAKALLKGLADTFAMMHGRVRESRVDDFRNTLMVLASDVAKASGGFSFIIDATSHAEEEAIEKLRRAMYGDTVS